MTAGVCTLELDPGRALQIKEQRTEAVLAALDAAGLPLVSLGLNLPGDQRVPFWETFFARLAPNLVSHLRRWPLAVGRQTAVPQVPEKLLRLVVVEADVVAIKMATVAFEEAWPEHRLVDVDVYDPVTRLPVDRAGLRLPARRCLICSEDAKTCYRTQAHSADDFWRAVAGLTSV